MNATFNYCEIPKEIRLAQRNNHSDPQAIGGVMTLIDRLLAASIIRYRDWELLSTESIAELLAISNESELLEQLVKRQLLTPYQAGRIRAGTTFGLILGNYRVIDRLGAGGMGIVFKAEHMRLPRLVAIKLIPIRHDEDPLIQKRFEAEISSVAQMQHPNIVGAIDAGETVDDTDFRLPRLHYFVMDYIAGEDLEVYVGRHGPLTPMAACDLVHQVASALAEANKYNLVHRDIKPSNIVVTPEGQAKLLDFGLVRHSDNRLTTPGTTLGTLDYLAPEQARDASSVDIRADLYGLGGTLYWCLTGQTPFPSSGQVIQDLVARSKQQPPSVLKVRSGLPPELDAIVSRMMATNPNERYPTPESVMQALMPFLRSRPRPLSTRLLSLPLALDSNSASTDDPESEHHRILIVDVDPIFRRLCRYTLQGQGLHCDEAANGALAWQALQSRHYDMVISDNDIPKMSGLELLKRLRETPPSPHLKVIMFSGRATADEMAQLLSQGADDYLTKPVSISQFLSRVKAALRLKDSQDQTDLLNRHLLAVNAELERNQALRDSDLANSSNALILALAELVSCRDTNSTSNNYRVQQYCESLARTAMLFPSIGSQITTDFISLLKSCAPLRDIGKIGIPDHILLKPGQLDPEERLIMQAHTTIGADTLQKVAQEHRCNSEFLQMASDTARYHHERFDGKGYPNRLAGTEIPLAARIVAFADVYDALRSRRPHKPALSHAVAIQSMTETAEGQFDPILWQAFLLCADEFERISLADSV